MDDVSAGAVSGQEAVAEVHIARQVKALVGVEKLQRVKAVVKRGRKPVFGLGKAVVNGDDDGLASGGEVAAEVVVGL